MSEGFEFLWIDDDESRSQTAKNLEKKTGANVDFHNVAKKDIAQEIAGFLHKGSFDLVIVDHRLYEAEGALSDKLKSTGATAAEIIKDSNPGMPVVCVTKVDLNKDITFPQNLVYDASFNAARLNSQHPVFVAIAEGFRKVDREPPKDDNELLNLLDCPQVDRTRLLQILPKEVKTGIERKGYASVLWRWISDVLFARPGFLYDSMWTATLLGAKKRSFSNAKEKMGRAIYNGIFANRVQPRWWVSRLLEILYKNNPDDGETDPRVLGRAYLDIPGQGYSKCDISGKDLPDIVAFTDITNMKRRQVCLDFTEEHPAFQKLLFFEEMRIIKEDE